MALLKASQAARLIEPGAPKPKLNPAASTAWNRAAWPSLLHHLFREVKSKGADAGVPAQIYPKCWGGTPWEHKECMLLLAF